MDRDPNLLPGDEPLGSYDQALPPSMQQQVRMNAVHTAARVHASHWRDDFGPLRSEQMDEFAYQMTELEEVGRNPRKRDEKLAAWGYRDMVQFERVRMTFLKYWGRPMGNSLDSHVWDNSRAESAMLAASARREREKMNAVVAANQDLLAPVEGVSLDDYAKACLSAVKGKLAVTLAALGMDQAKFERVSAGWNARMAADGTGTVTRLYGEAFTRAR